MYHLCIHTQQVSQLSLSKLRWKKIQFTLIRDGKMYILLTDISQKTSFSYHYTLF